MRTYDANTLAAGLVVEYGDSEENPIPVAIETSRGLLVAVLRTGKRHVFAINPMAAARYRDRYSVSRKKSDPVDALVLANILRTDLSSASPTAPPRPGDTPQLIRSTGRTVMSSPEDSGPLAGPRKT